jgi:hypothetical protein
MQELIKSKRFWVAVAGIAASLLKDVLPINEQQITEIVMVLAAWIVGDSLRATVEKK